MQHAVVTVPICFLPPFLSLCCGLIWNTAFAIGVPVQDRKTDYASLSGKEKVVWGVHWGLAEG